MPARRPSIGRKRNLLIELGCEELPPKALKKLATSFAECFYDGLVDAGVVESAEQGWHYYATPRRLAVWVKGVLPRQGDSVEQRRGPAVKAAFDDNDQPTAAAEGFARSCGTEVSKLKRMETEKGAWLVYEQKIRGQQLKQVVTECLADSIRALPVPKRMRWGDGEVEFVRPVHWLLALYGSDTIKTSALGLTAGRFTRGHRFHSPTAIRVPSADRYASTLKTSGWVIADYESRQCLIRKQIERVAAKQDARAEISQALLDEVTGLVEWPVTLLGEFDKRFLKLPREVLVSTMTDHQKYFPITNHKGKLKPLFATVSNIKSKSPKRVRQGNERVLRARLSDAEFFWRTDQQVTLAGRIPDLQGVMFHKSLGSIHDKCQRMEKLALEIAGSLQTDASQVGRAVWLCKTDLVTQMVGEFPALQGVVGRYYARKQDEPKMVCKAIEAHYLPKFAGDELPKQPVSQAVALADRIDTLVGIFCCGEIPSGDKDPFALRRAALAVLRILIEEQIDLDLQDLLESSLRIYQDSALEKVAFDEAAIERLSGFIADRQRGYFQAQGYDVGHIAAVQACSPTRPLDFARRLQALSRFFKRRKVAARSLASSNKRIANILAGAKVQPGGKFKRTLSTETAEKELSSRVNALGGEAKNAFEAGDYNRGFEKLAGLKGPIDTFFDSVMVMHDDEQIRNNRLALLFQIRGLFLDAADLSHIQVPESGRS